ncbi:uncharacterized protein METZ01_LOCUS148599 [marine metagenome]|uniref:Glycosyltransferase RgtA/B/C/D-like domain-containing protein n=1 Tax=marine metagenome TaxID=408172 RepID=A0A382A2I2_9ZZZZ
MALIYKNNFFLKVTTTSSWILIGVLVSTIFHYPLLISSFNYYPGDEGDSRFIAFILEHLYRWFNNKSEFSSPTFFYPATGTLGFSDSHVLHAVVFSIIRIFEDSVLKSFSISIFILNTLTYFSSFCFIRYGMKLNLFPSIIGSLIFSFNSAKLNLINHAQLQPLLLIPLISWLMILLHDGCNRNNYRLKVLIYSFFAVSLYHLQLWTSFYVTWFFTIILLFGISVLLLTKSGRTYFKKFVKNNLNIITFTCVIFVLFLLPFIDLYLPILKNSGGRSYDEVDLMLPRLTSYLWMGHENLVWGWIPKHNFYSLPMWPEHRIGIGLIFSCFALLSFSWALRGFLKIQKGRLGLHWAVLSTFPKISARFDSSKYFLLIGCLGVLVFFILSLRIDSSLWGIIYSNIPGGNSVRAVTRYVLIAYFFVGIYSALLLHQIQQKVLKSNIKYMFLVGLSSIISIFGIVEQTGFANSFDSIISSKWTNAVVKKIDPNCDSFYLTALPNFPRPFWAIHTDAMMASHLTNIPTINGYSGSNPRNYSLWNPKAKDIKNSVKEWKSSMNIEGNICIIQHEFIR